ncbi:MAG: glycosyltransferase, partial [Candidatus Lokiarchaeota archaeon]|nr:glycosyltransferase [Candidatus Lokiarchaeota archaeon]
MKVLFILADLGGDFRRKSPFIYSQGESLKKIGLEVDYFLLRGRGFLKYVFGIGQLKKYLKNKDYDILHAHYSYAGLSATFASKKPLIVSLMGSDIYSRENIIKRIINKIVLRRVLYKSDIIICKSEKMKDSINREKDIYVIPNGVDFNVFYPIDKKKSRSVLGLSLEKKYILIVGNTKRKEKNFKLAKKVYDELDKIEVELLVINNKSQEELNLYYNSADVLLMTSLYEGSPNVIKESMACNLPIVSTDVGDVKER